MGASVPLRRITGGRQDLSRASGISGVDPEVRAQIEARARGQRKAKRGPRPKLTVDLPHSLIDALTDLARAEDVAKGDLVALALIDLIEDHRSGRLDLEGLKIRAHSMRVGYRLEFPPEWR